MPEIFELLDNQEGFCGLVKAHYSDAPKEIAAVMWCSHELNDERIAYAAAEYRQSLTKLSVLLKSSNPDHYKRAGALLHALNSSDIVTKLNLESGGDDLESGFTRVTVGDANHIVKFVEFYEIFHNQALAFDLAYRCCAAYEPTPRAYDMDYLHNVCRYLKAEKGSLTLDACFMLFKSLMK